jgi:sRNA-binding carbon storage regulator CsrA
MLILSRKPGERLLIGDDVTVDVIAADVCPDASQRSVDLRVSFATGGVLTLTVPVGGHFQVGAVGVGVMWVRETGTRFGIDAPADVQIDREEVRREREREAAALAK